MTSHTPLKKLVRDSTGLRIWTYTALGGIGALSVSGGGACGNGFIDIQMCAHAPSDTALGMPLGRRPVVSPDQNGDLIVDQRDVDLAEAKLGGSDLSADFDGDGQVTAADVQIVRAHLGHHAPGVPTAVAPFSGALSLSSPVPNPFWRETRFTLSLRDNATVDVSMYDLSGRSIATIFRGNLNAGPHDFTWQGRDAKNSPARGGVYFALVRIGTDRIARRVVFLGGSLADAR